jgi:hypothetical protein
MKIRRISCHEGVETPVADIEPEGRFYVVKHGETGRGRWEIRLPLACRDFPVGESRLPLPLEGDFKLVPLCKKDARGTELCLLARARGDDGSWLILWGLSPGYRGGASYRVEGKARILALGEEAQGDAGRMGGAPCPVVLVEGPCRLLWTRIGRLYGSPADWVAEFDGTDWHVGPADSCLLQQAAETY